MASKKEPRGRMRYGVKIVLSFPSTLARTTARTAFVPGGVSELLADLTPTDETGKPAWTWRATYPSLAVANLARDSAVAAWTTALGGGRVQTHRCYHDEVPVRPCELIEERVK